MVDLIIDTPGVFARGWFAAIKAEGGPFQDGSQMPESVPPKATELSLRMILTLLDRYSYRIKEHPERMLACWDGKPKRDKGRAHKTPEFHAEANNFRDALKYLFKAPSCLVESAEADDCVATAAYRSSREGNQVVIMSGDKDLQQLAGGNIRYYCLVKKMVLTREHILSRWEGIKRPSQIAIALAIMGDPLDKIPGIRGYGPKKVESLFQAVSGDMNFSEALEAIDHQLPEKHKDAFYESLDLTLLDSEVEGVPEPGKIQLLKPSGMRQLVGEDRVPPDYFRVYEDYQLDGDGDFTDL